jgi:hypothetical protein
MHPRKHIPERVVKIGREGEEEKVSLCVDGVTL